MALTLEVVLLLLLASTALAAPLPATPPPASNATSFVTRSGTQLLLDGKPFYHLGFNGVWMPPSATFRLTKRVDDVLDAAQRMGLKSLRVWGFGDAFPYAPTPKAYNARQGAGLDYVIAGAGRRGLRVEIALANFWPAYLGPEMWLTWAETRITGKTVADFYRSERALKLLEQHITAVTSRINTLTGVAYKDDPTIMGWNLFNEPRCPGCTPEDMAARNAFISALSQHLRASAPKQLTFSGTEGFFAAGDPNVGFNPGAGSQCEGEDWTSEIKLFDVATTHMYERQMEALNQTFQQRPGFGFYIQYLNKKLQLYTDLAAKSGRPLVVEEFGLSKRFFTTEETKVVVAVVADALIAAKRAGTPLMGAWLWQAAPPGDPDVGGYDTVFTRPLSGAKIGLGNPPKEIKNKAAIAEGMKKPWPTTPPNNTLTTPAGASNSASASSSASASNSPSARNASNSNNAAQQQAAKVSAASGSNKPSTAATPAATAAAAGSNTGTTTERGVVGRRLQQAASTAATAATASSTAAGTSSSSSSTPGKVLVKPNEDTLDPFRRGAERAACAAAVVNWPEQTTPITVDLEYYQQLVAGHDVVDILAEAARLLSE